MAGYAIPGIAVFFFWVVVVILAIILLAYRRTLFTVVQVATGD